MPSSKMEWHVSSLVLLLIVGLSSPCHGSVNVTGDFKIVGLFKIFESSENECNTDIDVSSVMTAEAVKWYIQQLNDQADLPISIGFEAYATCGLSKKAGEHAVNVMNRVLQGEKIIGVIGPEYSSEAESISPILNTVNDDSRLVQVGFSTTAKKLTEENRFPNFVRVVPNDDVQTEMMVQSMQKLNWSRIAIIHEDNIYGRGIAARLRMRAEIAGICVSLVRQLSTQHGISSDELYQLNDELLAGTNDLPPIGGIVFIGSRSSAVPYLAASTKYSATPPIIMFSEGTLLDKNVFSSSDGSASKKTLGNYILCPRYIQVQEFADHWTSVFTNSSAFSRENATNSWLQEIFFDLTCTSRDCPFSSQKVEDIDRQSGTQSPFIKYAILAAHLLGKTVNNLYQRHCGLQKDVCTELNNKFKSGNVLDLIRSLEIDTNTDFKWSLASLRNQQLTFSNDTGDVIIPSGVPSYQLYNVQNGSGIVFTKIAELVDDVATIDYDKIRDYDASGRELQWPNVRKAQCLRGKVCSECIPHERLQEGFLLEPGDAYVIGIVPVFQKAGVQSCGAIRSSDGYLLAEAIRFAVLNARAMKGDFVKLFRNIKVGTIILNSCMSPAVAQRKILDLHKNGLTLVNGTTLNVNGKILGYIAEYSSTVSIAVADVLSVLKFVQIGLSTSPTLSNREKYPYFMRVLTPDDAQARAMTEIMIKLGVEYAQIVFSTGAYGKGATDKVLEEAAKESICIAQTIAVEDNSNTFEIYEKLKKYPHAKVVVFILNTHLVLETVSALTTQMTRGEFVFIGSESWAHSLDVLTADTRQVVFGSYTLSLEIYQDSQLRQHAREVKSEPFHTNPWASLFIQEKNKCYTDLSFDKTKPNVCSDASDFRTDPNYVLDTFDTAEYLATISLLTGAYAHLVKKCGEAATSLCADYINDTLGLVEEIKKVRLDLEGAGKKVKVFNDNGDGTIGYRIYNIQKDVDNPLKLMYEEIGRYPLGGTFTFEKDKLVYPSQDGLSSTCPNEQACQQCFAKTNQNQTSETTETLRTEKVSTTVIALAVMLALFAVALAAIIIFLYLKRRKQEESEKDISLGSLGSLGLRVNTGYTDINSPPTCSGYTDREGYLSPSSLGKRRRDSTGTCGRCRQDKDDGNIYHTPIELTSSPMG